MLLLELAQSLLQLGQLRLRPAAGAVLALVELPLVLADEPFAHGDRLAPRSQLVSCAQEQFLGLAQLRQTLLDLREPLAVRIGRGCRRERLFALGDRVLPGRQGCLALFELPGAPIQLEGAVRLLRGIGRHRRQARDELALAAVELCRPRCQSRAGRPSSFDGGATDAFAGGTFPRATS